MKLVKVLLVALLAGSFALTGCEQEQAEEAPAEEAEAEGAAEEEAPAEEEVAAEEEAPAEEEGEVALDEDMYIKAAFEVACVKAKVGDDDKKDTILTEVYARYGFKDAEEFAAAEEQFGEKQTVVTAVETRMEKCTEELAQSFAKAGAEAPAEGEEGAAKEGAAKEEAKKPSPPPLSGEKLSGSVKISGVEGGTLKLTVDKTGTARGFLEGTAEGKKFSIPVKGQIARDGKTTLTGSAGPSEATITGKATANQLGGVIDAKIFGKKAGGPFTVKK